MRKRFKLAIAFVVIVSALAGCYLRNGGMMMMSPKYSEPTLIGLTRAEVIQRLGRPNVDPQASPTSPWNEAMDGRYYLAYHQNWATCVVGFKDGKVCSVSRSWK